MSVINNVPADTLVSVDDLLNKGMNVDMNCYDLLEEQWARVSDKGGGGYSNGRYEWTNREQTRMCYCE